MTTPSDSAMTAERLAEIREEFGASKATGMKKGPPQSGEEYASRIIADLTKEPKP